MMIFLLLLPHVGFCQVSYQENITAAWTDHNHHRDIAGHKDAIINVMS